MFSNLVQINKESSPNDLPKSILTYVLEKKQQHATSSLFTTNS